MKIALQSFCKSNKILGVPIEDSYERFKKVYENMDTQYDFEKGLEALNKGVINNLKKKFIEFRQKECPNSYEGFIQRYEFITRRFWMDLVSSIDAKKLTPQVPKADVKEANPILESKTEESPTQKSKIPLNWDSMSFFEKLEFIKNIKGDDEFKAYIMALDPKIKVYFRTYFKPRNLSDIALSLTNHISEAPPENNQPAMGPDMEQKKVVGYPVGSRSQARKALVPKIPVLAPSKAKECVPDPIVSKKTEIKALKSHKDKMPVAWLDMKFSDRIDFARMIEDQEFKAYVLAQDPKIKDYLDRVENRKPHAEPFNLYVTLFSFPAKSATPKARALVKGLITALNKLGRGRLQYVELRDPNMVEIREVK